jgi:hypothetical protein
MPESSTNSSSGRFSLGFSTIDYALMLAALASNAQFDPFAKFDWDDFDATTSTSESRIANNAIAAPVIPSISTLIESSKLPMTSPPFSSDVDPFSTNFSTMTSSTPPQNPLENPQHSSINSVITTIPPAQNFSSPTAVPGAPTTNVAQTPSQGHQSHSQFTSPLLQPPSHHSPFNTATSSLNIIPFEPAVRCNARVKSGSTMRSPTKTVTLRVIPYNPHNSLISIQKTTVPTPMLMDINVNAPPPPPPVWTKPVKNTHRRLIAWRYDCGDWPWASSAELGEYGSTIVDGVRVSQRFNVVKKYGSACAGGIRKSQRLQCIK